MEGQRVRGKSIYVLLVDDPSALEEDIVLRSEIGWVPRTLQQRTFQPCLSPGLIAVGRPKQHCSIPRSPLPTDRSGIKESSKRNVKLNRSFMPHPLTLQQQDISLIMEPETRPISQEQLVAEVKGIYAGLALVENKYTQVHSGKNSYSIDQAVHSLNHEQWRALIALHRTLLHEHHDFFLASQHPSAHRTLLHEHHDFFLASQHPSAHRTLLHEHHDFFLASQHPSAHRTLLHELHDFFLASQHPSAYRTLLHELHDFFLASQPPSAIPTSKRLATKYAMPARMWRHGIHSFLDLLRHRLRTSLEHMLAFIHFAYSMMVPLYETVPAFEDTRIKCLGDLGGYRYSDPWLFDCTTAFASRMAIEDEDLRDREVWTSVSRHWYSRASDKSPKIGRLYHHLAILARPNAVVQLFFYMKSLCVETPFVSARESVFTLFAPVLDRSSQIRWPDAVVGRATVSQVAASSCSDRDPGTRLSREPEQDIWSARGVAACQSFLRKMLNSQPKLLLRVLSIFPLVTSVSASALKTSAAPPDKTSPSPRVTTVENASIAVFFAFCMVANLLLKRTVRGNVQPYFPEISMLVWNAACLKLAFDADVWEFTLWWVWLFTWYITYDFARADYGELIAAALIGRTKLYLLAVFGLTVTLTILLAAAISSVATLDVPALIQLPLPSFAIASWTSGIACRYWFKKESQERLPGP